MYAGSLLGCVLAVERETERLLEKPTLVEDADTEAGGARVRRAIEDAAELLVASVPIPAIGRDVRGDDDPLVETVLAATCESGVASAETVGRETIDCARTSPRSTVVAGRALVPLGADEPLAANWSSVFVFVRDRLDDALRNVGRVRHRIRADGPGGRVFRTEWRSIERQLASLAVLFEHGPPVPEAERIRNRTDLARTAGRRTTELFTE